MSTAVSTPTMARIMHLVWARPGVNPVGTEHHPAVARRAVLLDQFIRETLARTPGVQVRTLAPKEGRSWSAERVSFQMPGQTIAVKVYVTAGHVMLRLPWDAAWDFHNSAHVARVESVSKPWTVRVQLNEAEGVMVAVELAARALAHSLTG
ncbi:hypothetical protein [Streptomyces sp. CS014]|uniref:hypothetical protein n=1 Tax=Streptomyces sp. CS014 TaxID=2162707 RepID=UPI000D51007E|nr:hypothetical protein [Streptomyces sp. CS014]PVD04462.1 hypothetical protein DBP12_03285 [Streptomyces sp. CS014]